MASRCPERRAMVEDQIAGRGVRDDQVLAAMQHVPRELFVPDDLADSAYLDGPLPIGDGQTISQPYVVALMLEALRLQGGEHTLEIGAGSGYASAVLSEIARDVVAIERLPRLAAMARRNLERAAIENVRVYCDDGTCGWPEAAPFDAILVSAGAPDIPEALQQQLSLGGRLVVPVGRSRSHQNLFRVTRTGPRSWDVEDMGPVHFVPLIGQEGWSERS